MGGDMTHTANAGPASGERSLLHSLQASRPRASLLQTTDKFAAYRQLVPSLSDVGPIFLNAAGAPPSNMIVHEAIIRYASEALYDSHPQTGWKAKAKEARELLSRCINADPSSIAFKRDTTEGMGDFIRSIRFQPGGNVVVFDNEHPNQVYGWMALRDAGLEVRQIPSISDVERLGHAVAANADTFRPFVDGRTRAIGLSSIMFDTGQHNDVKGICAEFRPRGIHVLADLAQHVGFAQVDVRAMGVGSNCPTGIAALYVDPAMIADLDPTPPIVSVCGISDPRSDYLVPADPLVFHTTAQRFEHQNLSLVGTCTAGAFLRFYLDSMGPRDVEDHLQSLGDVLFRECDKLGINIVSPRDRDKRAPHLYILNLRDPRWITILEGHKIRMTPSRLGIRISFGFYSNIEDVMRLARVLGNGLNYLGG
ncbi:Uu.00g139400.m01.CDS01 [Anthostomella pinea]|uniref:Uu.00g139400.m01.CDS01 n=1 Tax=Anthostomella pinea TaxID=933095 RepID=A0AAI8YLB2_9PEZI|nr:Uu.00g139400.m01.CDS01 [Anthostomella pinea]